jgi:hypothetical protein
VKKLLFSVLALVLFLGVAGCGKSASAPAVAPMTTKYNYQSSSKGMPQPTQTVITIPPAATAESSSGFWGSSKGENDSSIPPEVIIERQSGSGIAGTPVYNGVATIERMVIKTANIALVVEDVNSALQQISDLANANGGYVINSNIQGDQNRLYGSISFRVDAAKFDQTLLALHTLSVDVRSENTNGQDVTEEFTDLDAQLRNLEASETQLLALMEKAGKVEDILEVQKELTNTRAQIEQIKGRMQYLQQSTALSSVYASLEQSKLAVEFVAYPQTVKEGNKVQFNPTISGGFEPYSFEWNFGDGKTSNEGAPSHAYKNNGTYTVTLTIKDDKGNTASAERKDYITVVSAWDAGGTVNNAWSGLVAFGRFLGAFFIWFGILSPIWIVILVILYFAWWRRRKKKA